MKNTPHPGRIICQDCIEPFGLSIGEAAEALGITRQTLDRLVNERGGVSPEMALCLAKVFGSTAEMWMRFQNAFDLAEARARNAKELATILLLERIKEPA